MKGGRKFIYFVGCFKKKKKTASTPQYALLPAQLAKSRWTAWLRGAERRGEAAPPRLRSRGRRRSTITARSPGPTLGRYCATAPREQQSSAATRVSQERSPPTIDVITLIFGTVTIRAAAPVAASRAPRPPRCPDARPRSCIATASSRSLVSRASLASLADELRGRHDHLVLEPRELLRQLEGVG